MTEPLKEQILKGDVHTIDEMRAWLKPLGYSEAINDAAINFILCEFVMSKVPSGSLCNAEMIVDHLHSQLEHQTSDIIHHTSIDTNLCPLSYFKCLKMYLELHDNPPFPAWKDGLDEVWN